MPSADERTNDGTGCRQQEGSDNMNPNAGIFHCNPTNYFYSGFISLQAAIDFTWISIRSNSTTGFEFPNEILLQLSPKESFVGASIQVLRAIIPLYLVISLSQFVPPMLLVVVEEKEKKIKESMKMVGLRGSVFWYVIHTYYIPLFLSLAINDQSFRFAGYRGLLSTP